MLESLVQTAAKVAVASLIVGGILGHFGITAEALLRETGLSPERVTAWVQSGLAWTWPNLALGAMIIVPLWLVAFILRPPKTSRE